MHSEPVQPAAQLQVSGAEHVPPFSQALVQIAVNHKSHDHTLWCIHDSYSWLVTHVDSLVVTHCNQSSILYDMLSQKLNAMLLFLSLLICNITKITLLLMHAGVLESIYIAT